MYTLPECSLHFLTSWIRNNPYQEPLLAASKAKQAGIKSVNVKSFLQRTTFKQEKIFLCRLISEFLPSSCVHWQATKGISVTNNLLQLQHINEDGVSFPMSCCEFKVSNTVHDGISFPFGIIASSGTSASVEFLIWSPSVNNEQMMTILPFSLSY